MRIKSLYDDWALAQSPVFVVGAERSGTSLLFQQVSNHPSFCDFTHATVETFVFIKPWNLLKKKSPENYETRLYLRNDKNFNIFQNNIVQYVEVNVSLDSQGVRQEFLGGPERNKIWNDRCYKQILRAFFYHSWLALGKKRLIEKTPAHVRCIPEILETLPNAKILICTREPGEIIASHKKRLQKEIAMGKSPDDPSLGWLKHSVEGYIKYFKWIDRVVSNMRLRFPDQTLIVPYGDLTSSPEMSLKEIFTFLDESPSFEQTRGIKRKTQDWDPLLNKKPQKNIVDISQFISPEEMVQVAKARNELADFWR